MTTEPAGRLHDLAARRRVEGAAVGRHDRPRRALRPDGRQGDVPVRDEDDGDDGPRVDPKSGLTPDDIDLFIPHQANIRIIEAVAKGLDLPMDKMYINLDKYGNTSAASVPIALAEAVNEGRVKVGDNVTIVAFGAGFTSGAVTIEWTADPARGAIGDDGRPARGRPRPAAGRLGLGRPDPDGARRDHGAGPARSNPPLDDVAPGEPEHASCTEEVPGVIDLTGKSALVTGGSRGSAARSRCASPPRAPTSRSATAATRRRRRRRRPRSRASAGGRSRSRPTRRIRSPPRRSSRPRSRRSARSTSSSTTPASPATT